MSGLPMLHMCNVQEEPNVFFLPTMHPEFVQELPCALPVDERSTFVSAAV